MPQYRYYGYTVHGLEQRHPQRSADHSISMVFSLVVHIGMTLQTTMADVVKRKLYLKMYGHES
ncbi:uncharacterized protein CC84DRAFT_1169261 [Paraphaeosphaeria sporulosa]|uniref:Uncharacterized protein n=1 Tax=Paraphaeosphaeria sporulosa TaxID=1460663 RepID=A0A177BYI8_9PLEO|nr:uncharacterized protein CC84DRAFT_1169261 [Paraphaeosphaeria sporulosa]OAF99758.1 hypothetical protein CC84DRAFT_1169261 [Paraphaeosphaeria sporulosa]